MGEFTPQCPGNRQKVGKVKVGVLGVTATERDAQW